MEAHFPKKRGPKYLDLLRIRQPLPAIVSILHRISGVLLFFPGIPLMLYALQIALYSPESLAHLQTNLEQPFVKLLLLLAVWFYLHHLCAGIRHLTLDLHLGLSLPQARFSSKIALFSGIILTALIGVWLW